MWPPVSGWNAAAIASLLIMKSIFALFLAGALCASAQAQSLLLSDFSSFTPGYFSQGFEGPWSDATSFSGPSSFSIADFGNGTPTDSVGNAFIQWLGETPQDWTGFSQVVLSGNTLTGNVAANLNFYVEDISGQTALTAFSLTDFSHGLSTVSAELNLGGIDASQIVFWGFQVNSFDSPSSPIGFEFDNASLATAVIPEPSTWALVVGGSVFAMAVRRRSGKQRHS